MEQQITKDERSLGELFSELATETSTLVKQEVALAQTELTQKAMKVGKNVGYLVVGGAVAYAALLAFVMALIIGLGILLANFWLAALIVGVVIAVVAVVMIMSALNALKSTGITPTQTVETIKEDAQWLKDQVS
jgi:uncharacterized membrane protein YqjE